MAFYKKLFLSLVISLLWIWWSTYAIELNSTNITSTPFNCDIWDVSCNLNWLWITSIASGTFINHTNLQYLFLGSNQITSIENGDFVWLSNLQQIYLQSNQITSIENGDFVWLSNLTYLNLSLNQITSLESGHFDWLSNLIQIDLGSNQITSIENGDFVWLTNLLGLYLQSNQITSIESGDFVWLTNLQYLYLDSNQITSVESGDFVWLSNLNELNLSLNQITSIDSSSFINHTNLQYLYLQSNQITSIESGDFVWLTNLLYLNLSLNQITSIESGDFVWLSNLNELYLSSNQITSIESGDFDWLTNLLYLFLGSNQITSIENGDFVWLTNLLYLYLESNQITSIESGDFVWLTNVGNLNLESNQITSIENGDFVWLTNLQQIYLQSNQITSIESGGFVWLTNLLYLYLESNCINIEDIIITNYLDTLPWINYNPQYVCAFVNYTPSDGPSIWPVTGSLILSGPISNVVTLMTDNTLSSYDHIFTENGIHLYDYTSIVDNNNYLWWSVMWWNKIITWIVTWIIDNTAPTIILNGSNPVSLFVGDLYNDMGATWSDIVDGTGTLIWSWIVNTTLAGTYIITYTVTDIAGNINTATRSVIINNRPTTSWGNLVGGWGWGNSINTIEKIINTPPIGIKNPSSTMNIQTKAYEWALSKWITTANTLQEARLDKNITRVELAKMISVYAEKILNKKEIKLENKCIFTDENQINPDLVVYTKQVCSLGIMGVQSDGKTPLINFNPNAFVTRAEFGTVLSRVLYGNTYDNNTTTKWREGHLKKLQQKDIINITIPNLQEQRGWIMIMLYRTQ